MTTIVENGQTPARIHNPILSLECADYRVFFDGPQKTTVGHWVPIGTHPPRPKLLEFCSANHFRCPGTNSKAHPKQRQGGTLPLQRQVMDPFQADHRILKGPQVPSQAQPGVTGMVDDREFRCVDSG